MESNNRKNTAAHCLILPYPLQGHINPFLQFAKRLQHKGMKTTLAITKYLSKTMEQQVSGSVSVVTISDGFDEQGRHGAKSFHEYNDKFQKVGSENLAELVENHREHDDAAFDCIIYDPFIPWVLDTAKDLGLVAAAFFTQSCAVDNIYWQAYKGELKLPLPEYGPIKIPGLPPLEPRDLPSFIYVHGSYPDAFEVVYNQFSNVEKADWIFINTFYKLEEEVIEYMKQFWPVRAIGPTIPSMYLDKRLQDDKEYGLSVFKPMNDACRKWIKERAASSVVYVSFGSLAELGKEQMEELAVGLKMSNKYFIWVVRASEESKLPNNFREEIGEYGLIVSWCPQLDILAHESVGCFITHCGWNSTLEALSLGVPMVAMPQWTDQSTNAKFVQDVWKMGITARLDDTKIVRGAEIVRCIQHVMNGDEGNTIRMNAYKWKEMASEAVDDGGSSDRDIQEFVSTFVKSTNHNT